MQDTVFSIFTAILLFCCSLCLYRIARGPTAPDRTLGIDILGTVVQQPYEFGYQSIIRMAKYIEGDTSVVPENELDIVPTQVIDASNVEAFIEQVQATLGN